MKVLLNVTVSDLENEINRQILVDENIKLIDLCELIIVSMNGSKIPIYALEFGNITYYPYNIEESKVDKMLFDLLLKDLKLQKNNYFDIAYNFDKYYCFNVHVDYFLENDNNNKDINFQILSGKGYGVLDDEMCTNLICLFDAKINGYASNRLKSEQEYLRKRFEIEEVNNRIKNYEKNKKDRSLPKRYIFNVSLEGFNKFIKRKISVNSDITIDRFCKKVITAMNGDLSHLYGIKIGKNYLSEYYNDLELLYLNLKEKQKFKIIYDWGDNWIFNLSLTKIIDGHDIDDFQVLSGKGYGIIDDCGGPRGLGTIFNGIDTSWGDYDIDDFDLEECNKNVK